MMRKMVQGVLLVVLSLFLVLGACNSPTEPQSSSAPPDDPVRGADTTIPPQGTSTTLDLGTWNLEWFGDAENGPTDEMLQLANVREIVEGLDVDLWAVQEVTHASHFQELVSALSGYDGFLANDTLVSGGAAYYSDFDDNEHKVGLVYKSSMVTVDSARVILTEYNYEFAGRPPVEVHLSTTVDGQIQSLIVLLLHAKAGVDADDWERRNAASVALKSYLDRTWPAERVVVIGDFNDDVDQSITPSRASPYKNFVDDATDYTFPTSILSEASVSSTVHYADMIDHHLVSNEMAAAYVDGTAQVFRADRYVADYAETTSDHYPVLSSYGLVPVQGSAPAH